MLSCRICLAIVSGQRIVNIKRKYGDKTLLEIMESIGQITVLPVETLPQQICLHCDKRLRDSYELQQQIQYSEKKLARITLSEVKVDIDGDKDVLRVPKAACGSKEGVAVEDIIKDIKMEV